MQWDPWDPEQPIASAAARFAAAGYDGLHVIPKPGGTFDNLQFLQDFVGLRSLSVTSPTRDDSAAFGLEELEELTIVTGSSVDIPTIVADRLRRLCVGFRRLSSSRQLFPNLERLRVVDPWIGRDLRILEELPWLRHLELDGGGRLHRLDGISSSESLESVRLTRFAVSDTSPLVSSIQLREVRLMAMLPVPPHHRVSFIDLASPRLETLAIGHADRLVDLQEGLLSMPRLQRIIVRETPLSDGQMVALADLPPCVRRIVSA